MKKEKGIKLDIKRSSDGHVTVIVTAAGCVLERQELSTVMSVGDYNEFARQFAAESGAEMIMPSHTCLRCGHVWVPRIADRPGACPKCHSAIWDRPRRTNSRKK